MGTVFFSWAPFPEPLGSVCEEQRDPGMEGLQIVTATGHLHQPSAGATLGGVGNPEFLPLSESVSSRHLPFHLVLRRGSPCWSLSLEGHRGEVTLAAPGFSSLSPRDWEDSSEAGRIGLQAGRSGFSSCLNTCSHVHLKQHLAFPPDSVLEPEHRSLPGSRSGHTRG